MEIGMTHASTTGEFDPEGAAPPASHAGDRRRLSVSRPVSSAPAVPTPRQQGSPVQRVTAPGPHRAAPGPHQAPSARTSRTPRTSQTVGRLSAHLARELGRTAADLGRLMTGGRGLTDTLGRGAAGRLRAAGALAVLAAPLGSTAYAQGGSAPPPAPAGVSTFDAGPATGGPATGGPVYGGPRGFTEPEQIFRGPEVRNPLFLSTNSPFTTRGRIDTAIGDGRGYENGYTRFSAFVPYLFADDSTLFFLDAGAFASFEQGGGANLGAGVRRYFGGVNRTMGASVWFDYDNGFEEDVSFPRLGVSMESVGKYVSWRVNSYMPLDDREQIFSGITGSPQFVGRTISLTQTDVDRLAYRGIEAEAGGPLPVAGKYGATGFAGVYALQHDDAEDSLGVSGRLDFRLSDDLSVGGKITGDDVFGTNLWATFSIASPRGSWYDFARTGWFRQPSVFESLDDSVERQYRSMNLLRRTDADEALTNADGTELLVCHIDPTAAGGGDGSIENPFASFAPILDGVNCVDGSCDIVRVIASAGPTELRTTGPLNLSDNQLLLSTAEQQLISGAFRGAAIDVLLPGFTGGERPTLFNDLDTPSYVIGLGDNNVVSGFTIDGSGPTGTPLHDGIISVGDKTTLPADFNTAQSHAPITSFAITRNTFLNVRDGVDIEHVGNGTGLFTQNLMIGPGFGDPALTPQDPGFFRSGAGFDVSATGGSLDLLVQSNVISGFTGEDLNRNGVLDAGEDFRFNNTLTEGAGALDEGHGIRVAAFAGAAVTVDVLDNTVGATATAPGNETGVTLQAVGATIDADVAGNVITGNTGRRTGLKLLADANATLTARVVENVISNNGLPPVSDDAPTVTFGLTPIPVPDNLFVDIGAAVPVQDGDLGAQVLGRIAGSSTLNLSLIDNVIARDTAGGDGVRLVSDEFAGASTINFLAQGNEITGREPQLAALAQVIPGDLVIAPFPLFERLAGITVEMNNGSLQAQIGGLSDGEGNTLDQNAGAGIAVELDGTALGQVAILGNVVTNTAYDESTLASGTAPVVLYDVSTGLGVFDTRQTAFDTRNQPGQITEYQGDAIFVSTDGNSRLVNSVINRNTVTGQPVGDATAIVDGDPFAALPGLGDIPGDGIDVVARGISQILNLTIGDPAGPTGNGNVATGNGFGISVRREGAAVVDDLLIADNFAAGNVSAGLVIAANGGANDELDVRVVNNNLNANGVVAIGVDGVGTNGVTPGGIVTSPVGGDGLVLIAGGAQTIRAEVVDNTMRNNADDGILLADQQTFGDVGTIVGVIARNDASLNGGDGLDSGTRTGNAQIDGPTRQFAAANTLTPADRGAGGFGAAARATAPATAAAAGDELFVASNTFSDNSLSGVRLGGSGSATFVNNLIERNGAGLPTNLVGQRGGGAGIDIVSGANDPLDPAAIFTNTYFGLNFNGDRVRGNLGDGIEMRFTGFGGAEGPISGPAGQHFVRFTDVQVVGNGGRGYDVLNQGTLDTTLEILGTTPSDANSFVSGNGGEGVYVVNTTSVTQTQDGPTPTPSGLPPFLLPLQDPTHGLNNDGSIFTDPSLIFRFENNVVLGNGGASGFGANGVVLRVGSSDGGRGFGDQGGFASDALTPTPPSPTGAVQPGPGGGPVIQNPDAITRLRGGVVGLINNNTVLGNVGNQFLFESFTSTEDPPTAAFSLQNGVTNFFSDPKARLDLIFTSNFFSVANTNQELEGAETVGAFYNNDEADVKSRPVQPPGSQEPDGPFPIIVNTDRNRNAQRLDIYDPSISFFPITGGGESTFRVNGFNTGVAPNLPPNFIVQPGDAPGTFTPVTNNQLFGPLSAPGSDDPFDFAFPFIWNLE